jgi:lipid-A-disaccharide synthase
MLVLFPFEVPFYERHGLAAVHVGHPLVDEVPVLPQAWERLPRGKLPARYEIALLPGSRRGEIETLLPLQLAALDRIAAELPVAATLVRAPSVGERELERHLAAARTPVRVVAEGRFEAIAASHLALCASGTATLETGLLGTPLVVLYQLSPVTHWLARRLVKVPFASLVNLVLERPVAPELIQVDPGTVAREAIELLRSRAAVDRMRRALAELRPRLGRPGAAERAAAEVLALLEPLRPASGVGA